MTIGIVSEAFFWAIGCLRQVKINKEVVSVHWQVNS